MRTLPGAGNDDIDRVLAKADEPDALALLCLNDGDRADYTRTANGRRRNAATASEQEAWAALHLPR